MVTVSLLPLVISKTPALGVERYGGFCSGGNVLFDADPMARGSMDPRSFDSVYGQNFFGVKRHVERIVSSFPVEGVLVDAGGCRDCFLWAWSRQSSIAEARWKHWLKGGLLLTVLLALQNFWS